MSDAIRVLPTVKVPALRVLTVCTGNICRSPMAEQMLESAFLQAGIAAHVSSAGTQAMVGHDLTPETAAQLNAHGVAPKAHRSTQLTEGLVSAADLVLVATRAHRSEVVSLLPRASRYTFTIRQFARLVDSLEEGEWRAIRSLSDLVMSVAAQRGFALPPEDPTIDDVVDPYRQSEAVYAEVADELDSSVATITAAFARAAK
ncbi:arsenate reductase/protein-tyrosine-phosphatase family protein [Okibacterium fritillariae]|uniref:arsenate reductase/protein-tyrosine-phosphatase family protein n=1 Tax=Okibacterium fritillariae TaxID=123320 RepID=UPI0040555254